MAALCIQRRPTKDGFQYLSGGEPVGLYHRRRFFAAGYRAVTFRDGREKYVLRGFDPRTWIFFGGLLLGVLLPGAPRGVFGAAILAGLLIFPLPPVVLENGRFVIRRGPRRCFAIGQDCYELCAHAGFRESLVKNGRQIALYRRQTAWGQYDPPWEVLYSGGADLDIITLFCVYADVTSAAAQNGGRVAPWRDWVPVDRHPERANWLPPED